MLDGCSWLTEGCVSCCKEWLRVGLLSSNEHIASVESRRHTCWFAALHQRQWESQHLGLLLHLQRPQLKVLPRLRRTSQNFPVAFDNGTDAGASDASMTSNIATVEERPPFTGAQAAHVRAMHPALRCTLCRAVRVSSRFGTNPRIRVLPASAASRKRAAPPAPTAGRP